MTLEELRSHLRAILAKEEASPIDWVSVDRLCLELIGRLRKGKEPPFPHDVTYHYLDDPDIRRKDEAYGRGQRLRLQRWLDGEDVSDRGLLP